MIAATRIEVVADFYPALASHDKLAALPVLEANEVLVLCGDHDLLTPLPHSERIAAALPDATLVVVPMPATSRCSSGPRSSTDALAALIERVQP